MIAHGYAHAVGASYWKLYGRTVSPMSKYLTPAYPQDGSPEDRMAQFEDLVIGDLRAQLRLGHQAASVAIRDLDSFDEWDLALDEDVMATVRFTVEGEPSEAVIPLSDMGTILDGNQAEVGLVDIAAPSPLPAVWFALAVSGDYVIVARDTHGFGLLARSTAPGPDGKAFGEWLQAWSERSGVPG